MQRRLIALLVLMLVGAGSAAAQTARPQNTVRPTTSGAAKQGEVLTADPGTWTGTQPITLTYQWRRCDTNGANCANIIGATSKNYTLTSVDVGNRLRVRVRAGNSVGATNATSTPTAVVAARAPKSLALDTSQSVVAYGGLVTLTGSLANGQAGESVTITEHRVPSLGGLQVRALTTAQTAADGSFRVDVRPLIHTIYKASTGQTGSNAVSVQVRPRLSLARIGVHRFAARVVAARSFVGRYGLLQRWSVKTHHWTSVRRVFFTRAFTTVSPTVVSRAAFRARLGGARIRVLIPRSQAAPGYLMAFSNLARA
jgi:hypothetical protein